MPKTATMLYERLKQVEISSKDRIKEEQNKLKVVQSILKLLEEIDFSAEMIPEGDMGRIVRLLVYLKGKGLTEQETRIVNEIVNSF